MYGLASVPSTALTSSVIGAGAGSAVNKIRERKEKSKNMFNPYKKYKTN